MATRQPPGTRAKDSDRNDTCQILDSALADGQLSGLISIGDAIAARLSEVEMESAVLRDLYIAGR